MTTATRMARETERVRVTETRFDDRLYYIDSIRYERGCGRYEAGVIRDGCSEPLLWENVPRLYDARKFRKLMMEHLGDG